VLNVQLYEMCVDILIKLVVPIVRGKHVLGDFTHFLKVKDTQAIRRPLHAILKDKRPKICKTVLHSHHFTNRFLVGRLDDREESGSFLGGERFLVSEREAVEVQVKHNGVALGFVLQAKSLRHVPFCHPRFDGNRLQLHPPAARC